MPRATRPWRWTRAVGTALCPFLIAIYTYSLNRTNSWTSQSGHLFLHLQHGKFALRYSRNIEERSGDPPRWEWPMDFEFREGPTLWGFSLDIAANQSSASIPLWFPLLSVALPTALAWYRCRRGPRGHCRNCGYNLAGITAGVCPECGTTLEAKVAAP